MLELRIVTGFTYKDAMYVT